MKCLKCFEEMIEDKHGWFCEWCKSSNGPGVDRSMINDHGA